MLFRNENLNIWIALSLARIIDEAKKQSCDYNLNFALMNSQTLAYRVVCNYLSPHPNTRTFPVETNTFLSSANTLSSYWPDQLNQEETGHTYTWLASSYKHGNHRSAVSRSACEMPVYRLCDATSIYSAAFMPIGEKWREARDFDRHHRMGTNMHTHTKITDF